MNEEKFSGKAEVYDKFRPAYPAELADRLYEKTAAKAVADIGAGTGKFTACLADKPWAVTAVEPNPDMREYLRKNFPDITIIGASAEDTGIPSGSVGLVTAAQAFHWFDRERFKAECIRILTPGGSLAIIWNTRLDTELNAARGAVFKAHCGYESCEVKKKVEKDDFVGEGFFSGMETFVTESVRTLDREGFIGDTLSRSHAPKEGEEGYERFVDGMGEVFEKFQRGGVVEVPYRTTCYLGKF